MESSFIFCKNTTNNEINGICLRSQCKCSDCEFDRESKGKHEHLLNPLLIPNILQNVLNFLPSTSLGIARLVCQQWNEEACRLSRKKIHVKLFLKRLTKHLPHSQASLAFTNYMLHMSNTKDFPHSHFEFRQLLPHHNTLFNNSNDIMDCFLNRFGSYITYLHVDILNINFQFIELLEQIQNKLLHLETLSLTFCNCGHEHTVNLNSRQEQNDTRIILPQIKYFNIETNRSREEEYLTNLLPSLLILMPNLSSITSASNSLNPYSVNPNVQFGVLQSIINGYTPNLINIDVFLKLNNEEIQKLLQTVNFEPKILKLSLEENVTPFYFYSFLKKISSTIKNLTIKSPNDQIHTLELFLEENTTIMKSLELLQISTFYCGSLPSLHHIPKLKKLKLSNLNADAAIPSYLLRRVGVGNGNGNGMMNHPLSELDITSCTNQDIITLKTITQAFKNLKVLSFDPTDLTMKIIYENLPQLEELYIGGDDLTELTDYGICTIPLEYCKELLLQNGNDTLENMSTILNIENRDPYHIGRLQNLTTLKLEFKSMTDASVLFGIIYCNKLKRLTLGSSWITEKSLLAVVENLESLLFFNITLCTRKAISFNTLCFVQEKLKNHGEFIIDDGRPGNRGQHD